MDGFLLKIDSTVYIVPNEVLSIWLLSLLFTGVFCWYCGTLK